MFELIGKRAVVTGAASGIGFAIGQLFASQGASVVLIDLDSERLNLGAAAIKEKTGALISGFACDVGSEESVEKIFAEIAGPVDILVNCAGLAHVGNLQSTSCEDFERLFAVNVCGTYLCMRVAIKAMLEASHGSFLIWRLSQRRRAFRIASHIQ